MTTLNEREARLQARPEQQEVPVRKEYRTPELTVHGDVEAQTGCGNYRHHDGLGGSRTW